MHNFHLLEVVARGSETQLQVGENLNKFKQNEVQYTFIHLHVAIIDWLLKYK